MSPVATRDLGALEDLTLNHQERAAEAGELAAARERELGADQEAVQAAYDRAHAEVLAEPEPEPQPESGPVPDVLSVNGTVAQRKWSGKAPTETLLRLSARPLEVKGAFRKGDRLSFRCEAVVISEGVKDKLDKETMAPVEAVQEHTAVVLDLQLTDE